MDPTPVAGKLIRYEVGTCCRLSFYALFALVIRGIAASKYQILPPLPIKFCNKVFHFDR